LKTVIPKKLTEARMARGLTMSELSNLSGISKQSISKYEMGDRNPSYESLSKIAKALNFSNEFFTFKDDIESPQSQGVTFFRSLASATADLRAMVDIRNIWSYRIFTMLSNYINFPAVNLPNIDNYLSKDSLNDTDIDKIAQLARKHWGLSNGPISNVMLLLEKNGIVVSKMKLENVNTSNRKIDACSIIKNGRPFIFLEDNASAVRNRFNLAHELGHILLHNNISSIDLEKNKGELKKIEKEANKFASSFLLPESSFPNEVMSLSLGHLLDLKSRWKVSLAAIIYRCEELTIFTPNQALYLRKQISAKKWRKVEPLDDTLKSEQPTLFSKSINLLLDNNIIQKSDFKNFVGYLPNKEIYELTHISLIENESSNINLGIRSNLKVIKGSL
jgi:Zn-dependent peptidase ImmA (M78 family)/transcriptional regulator with XRE-family HTH domain